jgi:hypothetical protein
MFFTVSSLKSAESVKKLLNFCCRRVHPNPIIIQKLPFHIARPLHTTPLDPLASPPHKLKDEMKMEESAFKTMLQYIQSIGHIVQLPMGFVFTDPTMAPKIAAKFISPKEVRLALLKEETEKVQILDETEIGCLLDIDVSENER